jgi:hypothetical protein
MDEFAVDDAREMAFQAKEQMRTLQEVTSPGIVTQRCTCLPLHRINDCCFVVASGLQRWKKTNSPVMGCPVRETRPADRQSLHAKTPGTAPKRARAPHTLSHPHQVHRRVKDTMGKAKDLDVDEISKSQKDGESEDLKRCVPRDHHSRMR